ncbi:acyl-CoA reductase [Portibacter lacus]|uniref:Acyl-CoA reductase n=1 Tax=Portibacter lacus TaxID=1099794 RepID=A0AA37SV27_9BACT|nr:acyl-CoA reductase [Portibacter lacus]GLR20164.1 acyl-CoA reductase [Portibacter lacus]
MSIESKIAALVELGEYIRADNEELKAVKIQAKLSNPWFTIENIDFALHSIADQMLDEVILKKWLSAYDFGTIQKKVGLILAGNIPLVGFHDLLCTFLSGHQALVKTSSKDSVLTIHLLDKLAAFNAFVIVEKLSGMDAVIATGSNQSAKQFERYFANYPNIIRRNRNAIAVLEGELTEDEIKALGQDIFAYFGLGCRNVSKIYIDENFNKVRLMEVLHEEYKYLINHVKYKNNYDYNNAIFLLNADDYLASGAVLLRRSDEIVSRIACLHYETFSDRSILAKQLRDQLDEIQCISGNIKLDGLKILPLGDCQKPMIDDYADGIDTMAFLAELSKS